MKSERGSKTPEQCHQEEAVRILFSIIFGLLNMKTKVAMVETFKDAIG